MPRFGLRLTPQGHLIAEDQDDAPELDTTAQARLAEAFAQGSGYGLMWLGAGEVGHALPPVFVWWRAFAARYVGAVCLSASGREEEDATLPVVPPPDAGELATLVLTAPMMAGGEYLTEAVLLTLWDETALAFAASLAGSRVGLQRFLNGLNPAWNLVGRVHFNLAENRRDAEQPFAFMATYTARLSAQARAQHVPLGQALREYAGAANLKTDKSVIADLPDKTEFKALCGLSRRQTALYGQAVEDLGKRLNEADGIQRKGVVLAMLMRLKRICNHPSHWLNDAVWAEEDSGKWGRLREIAEVVAAKQEKMLVFTQFREMTAPLAAFLGQIFGRPGLVLHGETAVKNRKKPWCRRSRTTSGCRSSCCR